MEEIEKKCETIDKSGAQSPNESALGAVGIADGGVAGSVCGGSAIQTVSKRSFGTVRSGKEYTYLYTRRKFKKCEFQFKLNGFKKYGRSYGKRRR